MEMTGVQLCLLKCRQGKKGAGHSTIYMKVRMLVIWMLLPEFQMWIIIIVFFIRCLLVTLIWTKFKLASNLLTQTWKYWTFSSFLYYDRASLGEIATVLRQKRLSPLLLKNWPSRFHAVCHIYQSMISHSSVAFFVITGVSVPLAFLYSQASAGSESPSF